MSKNSCVPKILLGVTLRPATRHLHTAQPQDTSTQLSRKTPPRSPHTRPCHPNCDPVATSQDPSPQWPGCASVSAWDRHLQTVHHTLKQAIIRRARWPTNDCNECPTYAAVGGIPPTNLAHDVTMNAYHNNHSATAKRVRKRLPKEPNQVASYAPAQTAGHSGGP